MKWKTKNLSHLCDIQSGLWKGKKGPYTKIPVLRNTNFNADGNLNYSNAIELSVETKQLESRKILPYDIILEKSGGGDKTPVGRVCIHNLNFNKLFSFSNFTARIRVLDTKILNPRFLHKFLYYLYLTGKTENMQRNSTGIRNLQLSMYKKINVPIPTLTEQDNIITKFDNIFPEIDRNILITKNQIKKFDEIYETFINKNFRNNLEKYPQTTVGESCQFFNGKAHEKDINENGTFSVVNSKFISSEGKIQKFTNKQMFPLVKGDLLMVMSDVPNGKTLAKTYLVEKDNKYSLNQRICCIRTKKYKPEFLKFIVNRHPHFLKFNNGENQTNLRKENILSCKLPEISKNDQENLIVKLNNFSSKFREAKLLYIMKLNNYVQLRKSIFSAEFKSIQI
jgi:type I restriction enzyme, S subunit